MYWKVSEDKKSKCAEKGKSKQVTDRTYKEPRHTPHSYWTLPSTSLTHAYLASRDPAGLSPAVSTPEAALPGPWPLAPRIDVLRPGGLHP